MRKLLVFSACAAALLLPSCMRWAVGEKILTHAETHVGLDYSRPVGNQLYCTTGKDGFRKYYAHLPEVRYRRSPYLISGDYYGAVKYQPRDITPTGRTALAEVRVDSPARRPLHPRGGDEAGTPLPTSIHRCVKELPSLPRGAVALPPAPYRSQLYGREEDGTPEPHTAPAPFRKAVASAVSCTIDPVLTLVTTTAYWAAAIPFYALASPVLYLRSQQAAPMSADETADTPSAGKPAPRP